LYYKADYKTNLFLKKTQALVSPGYLGLL